MTNHEIWQAVLAELELSISKANFVTWFKNTGILEYKDNEVAVCVPNTFNQAWLEKKYHPQIIRSLERVTGKPVKKLQYKIANIKNILENIEEFQKTSAESDINEPEEKNITFPYPNEDISAPVRHGLNEKYIFERFVVSSGTELAFAAAQAVVKKPGETYNPLFIYGGVGLGKTHLMQSIGHAMLKDNPNCNIMYASAEKFSNDFISSVKDGNAKSFQDRYRNTDLLLIDDIQFISGKIRTQESFFHTFNELHQQNKQVILTSDRPPKAIPALEDRLKSRFEWGMIVDVAPPDIETKIAVLQKKCAEKNFDIPPSLLPIIASPTMKNIRELEGTLNKIIAFHQLKNTQPSEDSVRAIISTLETQAKASVSPQKIIEAVCGFYEVPTSNVISPSREKRFSLPRQIIMFLMRRELDMSYPNIGNELGGRDHTTAMHADKKIEIKLPGDQKLKQEIELIKQKIYMDDV